MGPILRWALVLAFFALWGWYISGMPNLVEKLLTKIQNPDAMVLGTQPDAEKKSGGRKSKAQKPDTNEQTSPMAPVPQVKAAASALESVSVKSGAAKKRKVQMKPNQVADGSTKSDNVKSETPAVADKEVEADMDNKEFAKQFAQARAGTNLTARKEKAASKQERRAKKQAMRAADASSELSTSPFASTETSSMTGLEGDDEVSPITASSVENLSGSQVPNAGEITDMLESKGPGPASLRLTLSSEPSYQTKKKPVNEFQPVETKKQRQNRLKNEERRALVAESNQEQDRKKQLQMRNARLAEGTSAQSRSSTFKPPTTNAWFPKTNSTAASVSTNTPAPPKPALLDTFDENVNGTKTDTLVSDPAKGLYPPESVPTGAQSNSEEQPGSADMTQSFPSTQNDSEEHRPTNTPSNALEMSVPKMPSTSVGVTNPLEKQAQVASNHSRDMAGSNGSASGQSSQIPSQEQLAALAELRIILGMDQGPTASQPMIADSGTNGQSLHPVSRDMTELNAPQVATTIATEQGAASGQTEIYEDKAGGEASITDRNLLRVASNGDKKKASSLTFDLGNDREENHFTKSPYNLHQLSQYAPMPHVEEEFTPDNWETVPARKGKQAPKASKAKGKENDVLDGSSDALRYQPHLRGKSDDYKRFMLQDEEA